MKLKAAIALFGAVMLMAGGERAAGDVGWLDSFVSVWRGAGEDVWYDLNGFEHPANFHGANLGVYDPGSEGLHSELWLNSELNAWADEPDAAWSPIRPPRLHNIAFLPETMRYSRWSREESHIWTK